MERPLCAHSKAHKHGKMPNGKHTDAFIEQLVINTEGKTACKQLNTDDWGGYEQV